MRKEWPSDPGREGTGGTAGVGRSGPSTKCSAGASSDAGDGEKLGQVLGGRESCCDAREFRRKYR
jgi:hypothetical protein